jgi:hypothetical protein
MTEPADTAYYAERAREEHGKAQAATVPRAAAAHAELAARYEALASDPSLELPTLELPMLREASG